MSANNSKAKTVQQATTTKNTATTTVKKVAVPASIAKKPATPKKQQPQLQDELSEYELELIKFTQVPPEQNNFAMPLVFSEGLLTLIFSFVKRKKAIQRCSKKFAACVAELERENVCYMMPQDHDERSKHFAKIFANRAPHLKRLEMNMNHFVAIPHELMPQNLKHLILHDYSNSSEEEYYYSKVSYVEESLASFQFPTMHLESLVVHGREGRSLATFELHGLTAKRLYLNQSCIVDEKASKLDAQIASILVTNTKRLQNHKFPILSTLYISNDAKFCLPPFEKLKHVYIAGNAFANSVTALPKTLQSLSFTECCFDAIPNMHEYTKLLTLKYIKCSCSDKNCKWELDWIKSLPLVKLHIVDTPFTVTSTMIPATIQSLSLINTKTAVTLLGKLGSFSGLKKIKFSPAEKGKLDTIQLAHLSHICIGNQAFREVPHAIATNQTVNKLFLNDNNIYNLLSPDWITKYHLLTSITHLSLRNNKLNSVPNAELALLRNLEWVDLRGNPCLKYTRTQDHAKKLGKTKQDLADFLASTNYVEFTDHDYITTKEHWNVNIHAYCFEYMIPVVGGFMLGFWTYSMFYGNLVPDRLVYFTSRSVKLSKDGKKIVHVDGAMHLDVKDTRGHSRYYMSPAKDNAWTILKKDPML